MDDAGDLFDVAEGAVEEVEDDGIFMGAIIRIQCAGGARDVDGEMVEPCGAILQKEIGQLPDGEVETSLECPRCTERTGVRTLIPVAVLVGQEVADVLEDAEGEELTDLDDDGQPFVGVTAEDGHGPVRLVTESGDKVG